MRIKITPDETIKGIVRAAFPGYRGRKYRLEIQDRPLDVRSYWDGGSRAYFTFVSVATGQVAPMPAQSAFDKQIGGADQVTLPDGIVCVEHSIFCGKDAGVTVHIPPSMAPKMFPLPQEATR